jgi:hypothetical protein
MSAKKASTSRRTAPLAVDDPGGTKSAASRRSAEAELHRLIDKFASTHLSLVGAARRFLLKRLPTAHEVLYEYRDCFVISYSPTEKGYEGVLAIRASAEGVKLYFNRGKGLADPEKLLRGSGNQTRWVHLETASTLARPGIASLINEAIARNEVPFAAEGRGTLVVRSATAKKRSRRRPA